jgi:hypothetical protein
MKTKAIITSLVLGLGASSIAMASPSVSSTATLSGTATVSSAASGSYGVVVRDHRFEPQPTPISYREGHVWRGERFPAYHRPVMLGSSLQLGNDGRTFITVGNQAGRFGTLQLSAASGRTYIKQIYVQFENGQEQVIRNIDRMLVGNQSLRLDLDGNRRAIRRIVVYGNELNRGWRRHGSTFSVTAS